MEIETPMENNSLLTPLERDLLAYVERLVEASEQSNAIYKTQEELLRSLSASQALLIQSVLALSNGETLDASLLKTLHDSVAVLNELQNIPSP